MHTTEESSLIQLAAYNLPITCWASLERLTAQELSVDWPAQKNNTSSILILVSFQLRRFEDGSDNGLWPRCFSFRLEKSGAVFVWPGQPCLVWTMTNLRSKCLNSVVFCLLFYNSLASAWDRVFGPSKWHVDLWKKDPLLWIHCEWRESIQSKPVTGVGATTRDRKRKVIYFGETQLDLIFVKFRNQNQ